MDTAVRQNWRNGVAAVDDWERVPHAAGAVANPGEAGGYWVKCKQTGRSAWLKPVRCDSTQPKAAREKIAADLAHDLGVTVPPVLLHRVADPDGLGCVCLSLVCHPAHTEWGDLFDLSRGSGGLLPGPQNMVEQILAAGSSAIAFDAWLDNTDRNNRRNAVFGYDPMDASSNGELLFLDFSFSMRWQPGRDKRKFTRLSVPELFRASLVRSEVIAKAEQIAALRDDLIETAVARIPEDFIDSEQRDAVLDGLLSRRMPLVEDIDQWYPAGG